MKNYFFIFLFFLYITFVLGAQNIYCTGHDACRNSIWTGEYNIFCGASNSERTCKSTTLNCGSGHDCSIKTQGSGHDAYQYSIVNAKESNSFRLTCSASGLRDCKSITIWCPQAVGTTCECVNCPQTVTMKCVEGISCSSVSNAQINYVPSEQPTQTNNNNNNNACQNKTYYNNITIYNYENITRYNDVTRYNNVTRYNDVTLYTYKNITYYRNITMFNYKNLSRYINISDYKETIINKSYPVYINLEKIIYLQNISKCKENNVDDDDLLNKVFMIGFFINLCIIFICIIFICIYLCVDVRSVSRIYAIED